MSATPMSSAAISFSGTARPLKPSRFLAEPYKTCAKLGKDNTPTTVEVLTHVNPFAYSLPPTANIMELVYVRIPGVRTPKFVAVERLTDPPPPINRKKKKS